MISNWQTERAFWRWQVPRQSAPVSPPPMIRTRFPVARISLERRVDPPPGPCHRRPACSAAAGSPWRSGCPRAPGRARGDPGVARSRPPAGWRRTPPASPPRGRWPHVGARLEAYAFLHHLPQAPVDVALLELEVGDAVAEQAADAVRLLEDRDPVAGAIQLLRRGQPRRSGADDGDPFSRARRGRLGPDPALAEGALDDGVLDGFDGHRRLVDPQHARGFAGSGADAAGEFRKVVGGVQHADRFLPPVAVDQVVEVRDHVVERAAGVAEGHAAIHAARALRANLLLGEFGVNLEPVVDAYADRAPLRRLARELFEAGDFTHAAPALFPWAGAGAPGLDPRPSVRSWRVPAPVCIRAEIP